MMINDFEVARLERLAVVDFLNGEIQSPGAIGAHFEDDAARSAQCTAAALVLMIGLSERLPATLFMTGSSWHFPGARPPPFPACGASGADGCAALHRPAQAPCALPHAHAAIRSPHGAVCSNHFKKERRPPVMADVGRCAPPDRAASGADRRCREWRTRSSAFSAFSRSDNGNGEHARNA